MIKVVIGLLVLDVINAFMISKKAEAQGLDRNEWIVISLFLFVLVWIPFLKLIKVKGQKEQVAPPKQATTSPPLPVPILKKSEPVVVKEQDELEKNITSPLPKLQEKAGVILTQFKPKSEITKEEYADSHKKNLEVGPTINTKRVLKRRKHKQKANINIVDEDMVTCPNCNHHTYPNQYGLCSYCGVRLK